MKERIRTALAKFIAPALAPHLAPYLPKAPAPPEPVNTLGFEVRYEDRFSNLVAVVKIPVGGFIEFQNNYGAIARIDSDGNFTKLT